MNLDVTIYALIAATVGLLVLAFSGAGGSSAKRLPLPEDASQARKEKSASLLTFIFPFGALLLKRFKLEEKLKYRLDAARVKLTPVEFFNLKLVWLVLIGFLAYFFSPEPLAVPIALVFGYIIPDIWLNRKIAARKSAIVAILPEMVDLIGLCIEAGLDFTTALKWMVEKITPSNAMLDELAMVLEEIKWGKSRSQALKDMSKRISAPEVNSFVQTMVQSERMGTPVAETFRIISEDTRSMRYQRGERAALKAPIKILLPLVLCILPVIAIIVGGPLLLQFLQGNALSGFSGR